jgi:hypothetical protein
MELLLSDAYRRAGGIGAEQDRLAETHARRAEEAFVRVGDRAGASDSLARQIAYAVERSDRLEAGYALAKLEEIETTVADWWRSYVESAFAETLEMAAHHLERCIDTAEVLGTTADHWRRECGRQLELLRGLPPSDPGTNSPRGHLTGAIVSLMHEGLTPRVSEHFTKGVDSAGSPVACPKVYPPWRAAGGVPRASVGNALSGVPAASVGNVLRGVPATANVLPPRSSVFIYPHLRSGTYRRGGSRSLPRVPLSYGLPHVGAPLLFTISSNL